MSSVELYEGFVRFVDAGSKVDFHFRWLRHNADLDRRTAAPLGIADVALDDGVLRVRWSDDSRVSRFPLRWLREHAYAVNRSEVPRPPSQFASFELDGRAGPAAVVDAVFARLAQHGAALVRREVVSPEAETTTWLAALAARGWRAVSSSGNGSSVIEDLRADHPSHDRPGADAAIELHTERAFVEAVPRYRLLQGVRTADHGGQTILVDARAALDYLGSLDRAAAELLAATPVRFQRRPRGAEPPVIAPIVARREGRFQIRSSDFTAAPSHLPFNEVDGWYRAHDRFVEIVRDPRHQYRFRLGPGDTLIYDNHRMLNGRTAFRGPRWVRSACFDPAPEHDLDADLSLDASG